MILSQRQIEEIAAAVTKDFNEFFFGAEDEKVRLPQATPIDQLAKDYLGLTVSFAKLSSDGSICGLTAFADTEYTVEERGTIRKIPLRKNQVLLDESFIQPGQVKKLCGKRRFTLAHECAHQILYLNLVDTYIDNGRTGTVFDRPEFNRLMNDIKTGRIKCLVVRDLGRFGRDYIEAGTYLERIFPQIGLRFIAIKENYDNFDTDGSNESLIIPLQNMINALYSTVRFPLR